MYIINSFLLRVRGEGAKAQAGNSAGVLHVAITA
jgi:hypothetical protein